MKKKDKSKPQPAPKPKEFAAAPFRALKGIGLELCALEGAPPKEKKGPAPPPAAPKDTEELSLFLDAMADVQRLNKPAEPAAKRPAPAVRPGRDDEESRVFLQAVESLKMDVRFSDQIPEEPARPAPVNRLRQLRRGAIRVDLELDLHGLTRDEAIENLDRFIKGAYGRGQKGVLVITGKGMNSPGEPVLKQAVDKWLRGAGKDMVAEFVTAPRELGGGGAVVVFLKDKKPAAAAGK